MNVFDRHLRDGFHGRQKRRRAIDDMSCTKEFEIVCVTERSSGNDGTESRELGELYNFAQGLSIYIVVMLREKRSSLLR